MYQEYTVRIQEIVDLLRGRNPLPCLETDSVWDQQIVGLIQNVSLSDLFEGLSVSNNDFGKCVQSGLLLWADALDASHDISQHIETRTGSYWHAIMHRREPDYSNSKYWFGRVGEHPIFPQLRQEAIDTLAEFDDKPAVLSEIEYTIKNTSDWDPFKFVDWCQVANNSDEQETPSTLVNWLQKLQVVEFSNLLEYSFQQSLT